MLNSSTSDPSEDSQNELPELARGVLELFSGAMASISFPDVDGAVLQRQTDLVLARRRSLEEARAALELATAELAQGLEELQSLADRGLAYARIYASAHPERPDLIVELAQLDERLRASRSSRPSPAGEGAAAAGKRGRKKAPRPELPFTEAGEASEAGGAPEPQEVGEVSGSRTQQACAPTSAASVAPVIEVVEAAGGLSEAPALEVVSEAPAAAAPAKRGRKKVAAAPVEPHGGNGVHGETVIERD